MLHSILFVALFMWATTSAETVHGSETYVFPKPPKPIVVTGETHQFFKPAAYFDLMTKTKPVFDVAFGIDASHSLVDKLTLARDNIVTIINEFTKDYPGSRFSISTFTDKPINPLGFHLADWTDYCLSITTTFEDTLETHLSALSNITAGGGMDFPEGQLDSMVRLMLAPQLGWRGIGSLVDGRPYFKVLFIFTDAPFHLALDAFKAVREVDPGFSITPSRLSPLLLANDPNAYCNSMDYPTFTDVGKHLTSGGFLPVFLLASSHYLEKGQPAPFPEMKELARVTGNPDYNDMYLGIQTIYRDLLRSTKTTGIIQFVEKDATFYHDFKKTIDEILVDISIAMYISPETTAAPTTEAPTTVATTVESTTAKVTETKPSDCKCTTEGCCGGVQINIDVSVS